MPVRRTALALAALAALALGGWPRPARARDPLRALVHTLELPGRVLDVDAADMDGDGKKDLVVSHLRGEPIERDPRGCPRRFVSVFLEKVSGPRFAAAPDVTREVPADAVAFAAGDFDPAAGGEVVILGTLGLSVLKRGAAGLLSDVATVSTERSFFEHPSIEALPHWDLAPALHAEARKDLLVPVRDGYLLFANDPARGVVRASKLSVPQNDRYGPALETKLLNRFLTFISSMPRLVAIDLDADRRKDLAVYRGKGLARFLQRPDGTFGEKPDDEKPLRVVEERKKDKKDGARESLGGERGGGGGFQNVRLAVADLDHDGYADLVVTKTLGEVGVFETLRTQFLVFRGGPNGWNEDKPDKILNQKGVSMDPVLVDWNGDGDKDLIVSSLRMDYFTNVRRAVTSSITITYSIYLYRGGEEVFPDEPDFTRDVEVGISAIERRGGAEAAIFEADLNGDRFKDMVQKVDRGKLRIVPGGVEESFFSGKRLAFKEDEAVDVLVPAHGDLEVMDVAGGGRDALVLTYRAADDPESRRVRVVEVAK